MFSAEGERQILPRQTKSSLQGIGIMDSSVQLWILTRAQM
ncbi:hypothetical protein MC7420_3584 [Coleofasciculus chthonoplastes PCC 7420]|uniref:Uncharacterized protein n=1 Tax=Coleofasciculus chthonoplastes PCC 7420 TaxID=118168 RepID=B4W045_9CYAN|nr:hypothetical protein MC7420_3584 [Coleofasciculus chthonoplastes PCC 7420]